MVTATATKLSKVCRSQKQKLQEKDAVIEELKSIERLADEETFNKEQIMEMNARLIANNQEL